MTSDLQKSQRELVLETLKIVREMQKRLFTAPYDPEELRQAPLTGVNRPRVDPLNHYTGEVSVLAIAENLKNGHTTFPHKAGSVNGDGSFGGLRDDDRPRGEQPHSDNNISGATS